MEFPIKVLIVLILCLIAALIIAMLIFGFGENIDSAGGSLFDFFRGLLGLSGE